MPTSSDRLELLYEVSRRLATFDDLEALVRFATRRTRELFAAEGCAVLLLDRSRGELTFPVSSQAEGAPVSEAQLREVCFPADRGIAGWVLAHGEGVLVDDVAHDARFYVGVDQLTGLSTRAILCAPLRARNDEMIGVLEVVNPTTGPLSADDLALLETLASDIAVAYEKADLQGRLRQEVIGLRQVFRVVGVGVTLLAALVIGAGVFTHLAWALPLHELPFRPVVWGGVVALLTGIGLTAVGRGWFVGPGPT